MIDVHPHYRLGPPGTPPRAGATTVVLDAGKGFGDGRHETTQLCLLALAYLVRITPRPLHVLDFGAGNGVLAIAAALAGATVEAVEIEPGARQEVERNAALNGVASQIAVHASSSEPPRVADVVLANVRLDVLLEHATTLVPRLAPAGRMVLSGLVATDVPVILGEYRARLPAHRPEVYARGEWRAVLFEPLRS